MISLTKIAIDEKTIDNVSKVLRSGHLAQGEKVLQLEKRVEAYLGVKHCIAVNSGTAGLHTALQALGIGKGDEVITTPFTFAASANSILMSGAKPVFADIDPETFNLNPKKVIEKISKKTKAILTVDLYGQPSDYTSLKNICKKYNLLLIADSCQAFGAKYKQKNVGALADATIFSLYATKNLMSGEGGLITTNSKEVANKCRIFRNHGQSLKKRYQYLKLGFNYRMTDVLATIAIEQLKKIDQQNLKRHKNAKFLTKKLDHLDNVTCPTVAKDRSHVFHQYVIKVKKYRHRLQQALEKSGIEAKVYYPKALYEFDHLTDDAQNYPVVERVKKEVLAIPVHPFLTRDELHQICQVIINHEN